MKVIKCSHDLEILNLQNEIDQREEEIQKVQERLGNQASNREREILAIQNNIRVA